MRYNFLDRQENGSYLPVIDIAAIVDKTRGYDNLDFNDNANQISAISLTGVTADNSDDRVLYISISKPDADTIVSFYSDSARTDLVATATIVGGVNGTGITITEENSSGIGGTLDIAYTADDNDIYFQWADGSDFAPYYSINAATTAKASGSKIGLAAWVYNESRVASKPMMFYGSGIVEYKNTFISNDYFFNIKITGNNYNDLPTNFYATNCLISKVKLGNVYPHLHHFFFCILVDNKIGTTAGGYYATGEEFTNCVIDNMVFVKTLSHLQTTVKKILRSILINCSNFQIWNTTTFDYNCIVGNINWGGTERDLAWLIDYTGFNDHSISDDPIFNDSAIGDYTLQSNSPCLYTGGKIGNKKMNIGAKNQAVRINAEELFASALVKKGCEFSGGVIQLSQFNVKVADIQDDDTHIVLNATASSTNDAYNNLKIRILSGTGAGSERTITDYDGASKTATINESLVVDESSFYCIEMELESAPIEFPNLIVSDVFNIFANIDSLKIFAIDRNFDVYVKYASTLSGLGSADYYKFLLNYPLFLDKANSAGIADEDYEVGTTVYMKAIQFKIKGKITG